MGCLYAKVEVVGRTIASAYPLINKDRFSTKRATTFAPMLNVMRTEFNHKFKMQELGRWNFEKKEGISARCGLICSANYALKLRISKEHLWLMPENLFTDSFAIYTDLEWNIN